MEKFEINEHGSLTAYHNDNKDITEVIVPDGVKFIERYVFRKYTSLKYVKFPDSLENIDRWAFWNDFSTHPDLMEYLGITFNPNADSLKIPEMIDMIANKNYSHIMSSRMKYIAIFQIYFNDGDDITTAYIKKNFRRFFTFLVHAVIYQEESYYKYISLENTLNIAEKLIKFGKFISKRNIKTYIKIAQENECNEVLDMLNEYKVANYGKV
ncbi:MAG: leucine-rich repeat domain-containing protein [Ruminococcus flavefaciens]|nr:leucine-rich repeat domain-containing protein [Ruminococcus flavefaciens]